jgi:AraC-like DNA-binding protein
MSLVQVSKHTITVETYNWKAGVNASREEAEQFLKDFTIALGQTHTKLPVAELKASADVVDPVVQPDIKKVVAKSAPSTADIKLAKQALGELYTGTKYTPEESDLAGRIAAAGFTGEELSIARNVVTMLSTYGNSLKQDKLQRDLGLRPFQFEKLFEVFFEGTFASTQREITLMRGAKMLEEDTISKISDIAKSLLYSKAGFRSAFNAMFGISPLEYRQNAQREKGKKALAELVHA